MRRALALSREELLKRLTVHAAYDVAYDLQLSLEALNEVMAVKGIKQMPPPAPLPDHCTWSADGDDALGRLLAIGIEEDDAVNRIEEAVLWAVREGYMHVTNAGELVKDYRPDLFTRVLEPLPEAA